MLIVLVFATPARAQSEVRIGGVVRDASGTGIPGATITATNQTTRDSHTATTAKDGAYSLSVAPGSYNVTASAPDFQKVTQAIEVAAGAPTQLDFALGALVAVEITVTATTREQALLDVPFSVAAPTEEVLRARGVENIEGLA